MNLLSMNLHITVYIGAIAKNSRFNDAIGAYGNISSNNTILQFAVIFDDAMVKNKTTINLAVLTNLAVFADHRVFHYDLLVYFTFILHHY